jgi:hypothetical protein
MIDNLYQKILNYEVKSFDYYLAHNKLEITCITIVIAIFVNLIYGKQKQLRVILDWRNSSFDVIKSQFAHLGLEEEPNALLQQQSYNEFEYYASGRINCEHAHFRIELLKYHCLWSSVITDPIYSQGNVLTIDIPIITPEYINSMGQRTNHLPIEFMMCQTKDVKYIMGNASYLKNFVAPMKTKLDDLAKQKN